MIDWQELAIRLTNKWTVEGKLPVSFSGDKDEKIYFTLITYYLENEFAYLSEDGQWLSYCDEEVTKQICIKELWSTLTEEEKTELMTSILGPND